MMYRISAAIFRFLFTLFFQWEIIGREHFTQEGGGILACNHASFLDPPMAAIEWPRVIRSMARKDLYRFPVFAQWMRAVGTVPVSPDESLRSLRWMIQAVREGEMVLIFPEGTRTFTGELQKPERGVGLVARKTGAPVYPCYIDGSFKAWPRTRRLWRPHKIRVYYGPPVKYSSDLSDQEISERIMEQIAQLRPSQP